MQDDRRNTISPTAAGLLGIVLGAVGTAALMLADKDTRKKANKRFQAVKKKLQEWSDETMADLEDTAHEKEEKVKKELHASDDLPSSGGRVD